MKVTKKKMKRGAQNSAQKRPYGRREEQPGEESIMGRQCV